MKVLEVRGPARLDGRIEPPPDKSIAHRALILSALAEGVCTIEPRPQGLDLGSTARVLTSLGIEVSTEGKGLRLVPSPLRPAGEVLDCGNSGTTARLMTGVLAGVPGLHELDGDASLRRRPMERLRPLEAMGARFSGPSPLRLPFELEGQAALVGRRTELGIASAQVKSALLLAGLRAGGETIVVEPGPSRDHSERMLRALGVDLHTEPQGAGRIHRLRPSGRTWKGQRFLVPPDPSSAAFWLAAGVLSGGELWVRTLLNPTRNGFLDGLVQAGCRLEKAEEVEIQGETVAWVRARVGSPSVLEWAGSDVIRSMDEIPILLGLMALGGGGRIRDAVELRHKESDRLSAMARMLTAMGHGVKEGPDGIEVEPGTHRPAEVDAEGDHRIALTAAVMALAARGWTRIRGAEVADVSYPGFFETLTSLGVELRWSEPDR
ncbi:MAG: 3-phosphoshikimate 1-carboxyvinyltransferase [Myxococcota bacterium]